MRTTVTIAAAALSAILLAAPALAVRPWNRPAPPPNPAATPQQQAVDYVHIMDVRGASEIVSVQWLPPLAMQAKPKLKALFDAYVVVAISHVSWPPEAAAIDTHCDEMPVLQDGDGKTLDRVADADLASALAKYLAKRNEQVRTAPGH